MLKIIVRMQGINGASLSGLSDITSQWIIKNDSTFIKVLPLCEILFQESSLVLFLSWSYIWAAAMGRSSLCCSQHGRPTCSWFRNSRLSTLSSKSPIFLSFLFASLRLLALHCEGWQLVSYAIDIHHCISMIMLAWLISCLYLFYVV